MQAFKNAGFQVIAVAPSDEYVPRLKAMGVQYVPISMSNQGVNPLKDLWLWLQFIWIFWRIRPDVVLPYTIKPNIYGSLAAGMLSIPIINNIAGLGVVFTRSNWLTWLVRLMYWVALRRSLKVFFQNEDDRSRFISAKLIDAGIASRLPGSGINLERFSLSIASPKKPLRFLLVARMLREKGIWEFVDAARLIKQRGLDAEFCLLGFLDSKNPSAISRSQMYEWVSDGLVHYLGTSDDVRVEIEESSCIVLPSFYKEGVPRVLLEAAAIGRPIITTDTVGCRDVVDHGVNGFLCQPKNSKDLANKIQAMIELTHEERLLMSLNGRKKIEAEFDEMIVVEKYMEIIQHMRSS